MYNALASTKHALGDLPTRADLESARDDLKKSLALVESKLSRMEATDRTADIFGNEAASATFPDPFAVREEEEYSAADDGRSRRCR